VVPMAMVCSAGTACVLPTAEPWLLSTSPLRRCPTLLGWSHRWWPVDEGRLMVAMAMAASSSSSSRRSRNTLSMGSPARRTHRRYLCLRVRYLVVHDAVALQVARRSVNHSSSLSRLATAPPVVPAPPPQPPAPVPPANGLCPLWPVRSTRALRRSDDRGEKPELLVERTNVTRRARRDQHDLHAPSRHWRWCAWLSRR